MEATEAAVLELAARLELTMHDESLVDRTKHAYAIAGEVIRGRLRHERLRARLPFDFEGLLGDIDPERARARKRERGQV